MYILVDVNAHSFQAILLPISRTIKGFERVFSRLSPLPKMIFFYSYASFRQGKIILCYQKNCSKLYYDVPVDNRKTVVFLVFPKLNSEKD